MQIIPEPIQLDLPRPDCRLQQMNRHIGQQQTPPFDRIGGAKRTFFDRGMDLPRRRNELGPPSFIHVAPPPAGTASPHATG